jgi:flagellar export protein FliJ
MRPYKFPLEAVLKLRKMKEEKALDVYAASVNKCIEKRRQLVIAERRHNELTQMVLNGRSSSFSASMQGAYHAALDLAKTSIGDAIKAVQKSESEKAGNLKQFLDLKRSAEVLVNLRSTQREAFEHEQQRKEEIEMEDLIMSRRAHVSSI